MVWESRDGPHRHGWYAGRPCVQGPRVKQGRRHGPPQARCGAGDTSGSSREGSADVALHADPALVATAVRAYADGHALRAPARLVPVAHEAVWAGLARAAQHGRGVRRDLGHDLPVLEGQLDERWSVVPPTPPRVPGARRDDAPSGAAWGWGARASGGRRVRAGVRGQRTPKRAAVLLARVLHVTAAPRPCWTSAPGPASRRAWRPADGLGHPPPRPGTRGRAPQPRRLPPPGWGAAHVVKARHQGRLVQGARPGSGGAGRRADSPTHPHPRWGTPPPEAASAHAALDTAHPWRR